MDVIHLEVGEPDFSTSASVIDNACVALRAGRPDIQMLEVSSL